MDRLSPPIPGELVYLRPVSEPDLPLLVQWRNDPEIWRWFFNRSPLTLEAQQGFYERLCANPAKRLFAICTLVGEPVGTIGLDRIDQVDRSAELGNLLIGPESARRKGFAREATELLVRHAFAQLDLQRLFLLVLADNERAVSLYERCGFQVEGRLRRARYARGRFHDVLIMARLRGTET